MISALLIVVTMIDQLLFQSSKRYYHRLNFLPYICWNNSSPQTKPWKDDFFYFLFLYKKKENLMI